MKKLLSLSFAILIFCVFFCGCSETDLSLTETVPTEPKTTVAIDVNYEEVYAQVLNETYDLIATDDEKVATAGQTGILEAIASLDKGASLGVVGYTFEDLNGDGFSELIIAAVADSEDSWYKTSEIFSIYTIAHDMPWLIVEGRARSSYHLLDDGTFFYEGSGGAAYSAVGNFRVSQGGTSLICNEFYFTEPLEEGSNTVVVYTNTIGKWNPERSEKTEMTTEDIKEIRENYKEKLVFLELTPFSDYK